jgi:hypothetical protein
MHKQKVLHCNAEVAEQSLHCNAEAAEATQECRNSRRYIVMFK